MHLHRFEFISRGQGGPELRALEEVMPCSGKAINAFPSLGEVEGESQNCTGLFEGLGELIWAVILQRKSKQQRNESSWGSKWDRICKPLSLFCVAGFIF